MHYSTPAQTVNLLFTDLVGSTELAARLGPVQAERVRQDHFALLRDTLARHGATAVKSLGDGLMILCPSTAAAVDCAVAIQQGVELANRRSGPQLAVRIGVALGDAVPHDGDWYGLAAVAAARLCAAAEGGQILVTELVHLAAISADGHRMEPIGDLRLKGMPSPVATWSVRWQPLAPETGRYPLPPALQQAGRASLVGRGDACQALEHLWQRARGGEPAAVALCGEAGIGKTRLAAHVAQEAHRQGALVLYGRSGDGVGLPYDPWRQALAHAVSSASDTLLDHHAERYGAQLLHLVPALAGRLGGLSHSPAGDQEIERHLLFAAAAGLLEDLVRAAPLVLVLDDLHWAGVPTLTLLRHVLTSSPAIPMLTVLVARDGEAVRGHKLEPLLAELDDRVARIALSGLDETETTSLLRTVHEPLDPSAVAFARSLHRQTNGNPFFLTELFHHIDEAGVLRLRSNGRWTVSQHALEVPERVTEVVSRRVARLGPDAERVLRVGAVVGREFDVDLVVEVSRIGYDEALDVLDRGASAHLLVESAERAGRFGFAHPLVGQALEERLSSTRRQRLHRQIAESLERRAQTERHAPLGELARHWDLAGADARPQALTAAAAAASAALAQLAPDEASLWFRRGLELHEELAHDDAGIRCDLLLGLAQAQLYAGGAEFGDTFMASAEAAVAADDHARLVGAALANTRGTFSSAGFVDERRVELLEAALAAESGRTASRSRLLALLSAELLWQADHERRLQLSDEALTLARESGDMAAIVHALRWRVLSVWWPETLQERMATTAELVELTAQLRDPVERFWALNWRAVTVVQAGDLDRADEYLRELRELVGTLRFPRMEFVLASSDAWRAQIAGRLLDAETRMEHARDLGEASGEPDAVSLYIAQLGPLRWHQGRLPEIADDVTMVAEGVPAVGVFAALAAVAELESGRPASARARLEPHAERGFASVPADPVQLGALTLWAEVAALLGHRDAAAVLLKRLTPLRDQVVLDALGTLGVVSRAAGLVAATLGRVGEADAHFAHALATHERMQATALAARTRLEWGLALAESDELDRARDLIARAAQDASAHGLAGIERRAGAKLAALGAEDVPVRGA